MKGGLSTSLLSTVARDMEQLHKTCHDLEAMYSMKSMSHTSGSRENVLWERKINQVMEETTALQHSLDRCSAHAQEYRREEAQRQELLQRRKNIGVDGRDPECNIDADLQAKERIRRSKQVAEEAYQTGVSALAAMAQQRDLLKNAHRKVLDVLNTVGMSDSVLRIAERRISVDKMIAYGGMFLITLVIIVWLYVTGHKKTE